METLKHWDTEAFLFLNHLGNSTWDGFWVLLTNQWVSIPIYLLLVLLILWKTGFKQAFVTGVVLFAMLVVTYGLSKLSKYGIARPRPCTMGFDMRYPLKTDCGDFGFFSSHASVGMALMLFTGLILKKYFKYIFWPLMIWLALFGVSRIYVGKHYPGDVIVGFLVGAVLAVVFYKLRIFIAKKYNL